MATAAGLQGGGNGIIDTNELVVLGDDLDQSALAVAEQDEVFNVIKKTLRLTNTRAY